MEVELVFRRTGTIPMQIGSTMASTCEQARALATRRVSRQARQDNLDEGRSDGRSGAGTMRGRGRGIGGNADLDQASWTDRWFGR
jgi:hypothetical protein